MNHLNAVILAGGSGTRLWPLSTPNLPKQFLPLPSGRSMIQETWARLAPLVPAERGWVVTGRSMVDLICQHLPSIPLSHILAEPMGRNSAPAIAWAAAMLAHQDPQAIMAVLSADAVITNVDALHQTLHLAYELAQEGHLVTLGIKPSAPETGYGYIRFAEEVSEGYQHRAFRAQRFVEKPNLATAHSYLRDGHYVWNSGMFIWKVETILAELRQHLPDLMCRIDSIVEAATTREAQNILDELWPTLGAVSIDYGVLEKTSKLVVIPADLGWNDVGNWEQYGSLFPVDSQGVRAVGPHIGLGSQNTIVYNTTHRQIYTIGLEDLIVVEVENITLICHKDAVQCVKELAQKQPKKS